MKKLVARVLVLILACIWTRRVAKGKDLKTLPELEEGVVEMTFEKPWEFQGLPKVTGLREVDCYTSPRCEEPYLKVVKEVLTQGKIIYKKPLTFENVKKITEVALKNNWIIPVGRVKDGNTYATLLFPVLENTRTLDEALKEAVPAEGDAKGSDNGRFVEYVSIEEHLAIAHALLKPLEAIRKVDACHGNVNRDTIVVVTPIEAAMVSDDFKVMKVGTELLLKDFKLPSGLEARDYGRFDAFGIAMTFADFDEGHTEAMQAAFVESSINKEAKEKSLTLGNYSAIGGFRRRFLFWNSGTMVGKMKLEMKLMWVFATLAALPTDVLTFETTTGYLKKKTLNGHEWVDMLWEHSKILAEQNWEYNVWRGRLEVRYPDRYKGNPFFTLNHWTDKVVHGVFIYTYMFHAAEDELPQKTITANDRAFGIVAELPNSELTRFNKRISMKREGV
eukprot:GHVS01050485.1.p1 GENE.GHVS01050485.1~~GHVS01050485.1.p1  ORF type:complete len:447 (+),score=40.80 GHVS01050485.1:132-1472(+)